MRVLDRLGYQVLLAKDGPSALAAARAHAGPITVLLSDVVMPGLGGPELYRQLRAEHPGLRALFVSGYSDEQLTPADRIDGVTAFLPKPFTPDQLAVAVTALLPAQKK